MNTDWKALCAELADVLAEEYGVQREFANGDPLLGSGAIELLSRARTALAQPEPPLEEQRCENCRYHLQSSNECRRNAPQPSVSQHIYSAWWPAVANDDWCGEWVKR